MSRFVSTKIQLGLNRSRLGQWLLAACVAGLFGMAACTSSGGYDSSSSGSGGSSGNGCPSGYCNSNGYCCAQGLVGCEGSCYNSTGDAYSATHDASCLSVTTVC